MTTLNENDQHCHQRPERPCEPTCEWECFKTVPVHDCDCHGRSDQRPESDWVKNFDTIFYSTLHKDGVMQTAAEKKRDNLVDFITRLLPAEYQRGKQDAIVRMKQELNEYDTEIRNLELQNQRLLDNNRALQAELREGNRTTLEECIKLSDDIEVRYDVSSTEEWRAFKAFRNALRDRLSSQQEPQDI